MTSSMTYDVVAVYSGDLVADLEFIIHLPPRSFLLLDHRTISKLSYLHAREREMQRSAMTPRDVSRAIFYDWLSKLNKNSSM